MQPLTYPGSASRRHKNDKGRALFGRSAGCDPGSLGRGNRLSYAPRNVSTERNTPPACIHRDLFTGCPELRQGAAARRCGGGVHRDGRAGGIRSSRNCVGRGVVDPHRRDRSTSERRARPLTQPDHRPRPRAPGVRWHLLHLQTVWSVEARRAAPTGDGAAPGGGSLSDWLCVGSGVPRVPIWHRSRERRRR